MDDEYEDIELLGDDFHHALLGAVYEEDGTPVKTYERGFPVGFKAALEATEELSEDMRTCMLREGRCEGRARRGIARG